MEIDYQLNFLVVIFIFKKGEVGKVRRVYGLNERCEELSTKEFRKSYSD